MGKQTIKAKDVVRDIRAGATDDEIMKKYKLSTKGLDSLFRKLKSGGFITDSDLKGRDPVEGETILITEDDVISPKPRPRKAASPGDASSDLDAAIAAAVNEGRHPTEIMQRYELSPTKLEAILERLRKQGLITGQGEDRAAVDTAATCPQCGALVPESAPRCGNCGRPTGAGPTEDAMGPVPPAAGHPPPRDGIQASEEITDCPWDERENYGLFRAYFLTAKRILLTPSYFFSQMPTRGGVLNPILFGIFSAVVSTTIGLLIAKLLMGHGGIGLFSILIAAVCTFVGAAMTLPIVLLLWSLVVHGILSALSGAKENFEATLRVIAYSSVTQLFNVIPYVGNVASLYSLVLTVVGLKEVHDTSTGKAVGAVLLSLAAAVLIGLVFWVTILASAVSSRAL